MSAAIKCDRCKRRVRRLDGWNAIFERGVVVGFLCPNCQTPQENAEAAINESTIDYNRASVDDDGRLRAPARGAPGGER